ncbi:MAG: VCBS repeat-containing protein, partial [Saprospiraceae bacterium]
MPGRSYSIFYALLLAFLFLAAGCQKKAQPDHAPDFKMLSAAQTGLHFNNNLVPTVDLNIFDYMYFYNGGGVATADFNKDGLLDLYFTCNQQSNKLFLNKGNLTFTDVTETAHVSGEGGWS